MNSQTLSQRSITVGQRLVRYRWAVAVGLLLIIAPLALYRLTSVLGVLHPGADPAQPPRMEPAPQSGLGELDLHSSVQILPTLAVSADPVQQSVLSYLGVHSRVDPLPTATPLDSAQLGVMNYVRTHQAVYAWSLDPVQQGVMEYLRAHQLASR